MSGNAKTRIVILGAGFGGLYTALALDRLLKRDEGVEVVLVSRDNYFLMTPFLFEAGSGVLEPRHAVAPVRRLLTKTRFVEADICGVDFDRRVVKAAHATQKEGLEIPYDQVVIALGAVTNRKIIKGSEHAAAFKTLSDAIVTRNMLIDLFEQAEVERDEGKRKELLTFVVIGGGLVGVELMGELTEFLPHLAKAYPTARRTGITLHLIEAGQRLLPEMQEKLAAFATRTLERRGVEVKAGTKVDEIEPGVVHVAGGQTIRARTVVLAAGVAPNPLLEGFELEKMKGRIVVGSHMQSKSRPEVWAIGDCAWIPDPKHPDGKPYPQLAQHALREAKVLARNIVAARAGQPLKNFEYKTLGTLASLGHYSGVGQLMFVQVTGFLAWWVWRTYYLLQMPRLDRKLRIVLDWTTALLFQNDIVKLDMVGVAERVEKRRGEEDGVKNVLEGEYHGAANRAG